MALVYFPVDSASEDNAASTANFGTPDEDHVAASQPAFIDTKYVNDLNIEKQSLDQTKHPHSIRLVSHG